jgi:membrane-associated phospholipid phosphatase
VITRRDRAVVEGFQHLHWGPADWCFEQLSHWWVKSLVIIGVGLAADLASRRRFPLGAVLGGISYLIATVLADVLKDVFDRPRPSLVDPDVHPLIRVPSSAAMPSGHAAGAFAAAVAVGLVHPRLRWPLLVLAALIALSRIWLGVHYLSDVLVGAALGTAVSLVVYRIARAIAERAGGSRPRGRPGSSAPAPRGR